MCHKSVPFKLVRIGFHRSTAAKAAATFATASRTRAAHRSSSSDAPDRGMIDRLILNDVFRSLIHSSKRTPVISNFFAPSASTSSSSSLSASPVPISRLRCAMMRCPTYYAARVRDAVPLHDLLRVGPVHLLHLPERLAQGEDVPLVLRARLRKLVLPPHHHLTCTERV